MPTQIELMTEAESRGLLTPQQKELMGEARRRGFLEPPGGLLSQKSKPVDKFQALKDFTTERQETLSALQDEEARQVPNFDRIATLSRGSDTLEAKIEVAKAEAFPGFSVASTRAKAIASGVDPQGAPEGARFTANLGIASGGGRELAEVKIALQKAFDTEKVEVRFGPATKQLEFRLPGDKGFRLFNTAGFDLTDIAAAAPEVAVILLEIAGGFVGAAGGPLGILAGISIAAFTGELIKLELGRRRGLEATDKEMITSAAERAGVAFLGAAVFSMGASILRRIVARVPKDVLRSIEAGEIREGLRETGIIQREFKGAFDKDIPFSVGQTSGSEAALVGEGILAQRPGGKVIRELQDEQQRILREVLDDLFPIITGDTGAAGRTLTGRAGAGPRAAIGKVQAETVARREEAVAAAAVIQREGVPTTEAGIAIREGLEKARKAVLDPLKQQFDDLQKTKGIFIDPAPLQAMGRKLKRELKGLVLKSLSREDVGVAKELAKAGVRIIKGKKKILPLKLSDVMQDLSNIRAELRFLRKTGDSKRIRLLSRAHDTILKARNKALRDSGDPDLLTQVLKLENKFARAKADFDSGVIGALMKKVEGGGFQLRDDRIIRRLLSSPSESEVLSRILTSRSVEGSLEARQAIRKGILGEYERRVVDPETGLAAIGAHKSFMRQNRQTLRRWFDGAELVRFQKPGQAATMLRQAELRERDIVSKLNSSFNMKLSGFDANTVVKKLIRSESLEDFVRARRIVRLDPAALKQFDDAVNLTVFRDITTFNNSTRVFEVSSVKLESFLQSDKVPLVIASQGKQFVIDLRIFARAFATAERKPMVSMQDIADTLTRTTGLVGYARFLRVIFPPLSPRGRGLTAVVGVAKERAQRSFARALRDPVRLHAILKLRQTTLRTKMAERILGAIGADLLTAIPTK